MAQSQDDSLRDKIGWKVAGLLERLGLDYDKEDVAGVVGNIVDFVPGVGDVVGAEEAYNDYNKGDYVGAGIGAAATAIGLIPGVGDVAGKAVKTVGKKVAKSLGHEAAEEVAEGLVRKAKPNLKGMSPDERKAYDREQTRLSRERKRQRALEAGEEVRPRGRPSKAEPQLGTPIDEYVDDISEINDVSPLRPNAELEHTDLFTPRPIDPAFRSAVDPNYAGGDVATARKKEIKYFDERDRPPTEKELRKAAADIFSDKKYSESLGKSVNYHDNLAKGNPVGKGRAPLKRDRFDTQEIKNPDGTSRFYDQNYIAQKSKDNPYNRYALNDDKLHVNSRLRYPEKRSENWVEEVLEDIKRNSPDPADLASDLDDVYAEAIQNPLSKGMSVGTDSKGNKISRFQGDENLRSFANTTDEADFVKDRKGSLEELARKYIAAEKDAELKKLRDEAAKRFGSKVSRGIDKSRGITPERVVATGEARLNPAIRELVKQLSPKEVEHMLTLPFPEREGWVRQLLVSRK